MTDNVKCVKTVKSSRVITDIDELLGNILIKNLFTGFGVFKDSIMFGLFQNDTFYLRAKNELATLLKNNGAISYCLTNGENQLKISSYYQLPLTILNNKSFFKELLLASINQVKLEQLENELSKKNRIKDLFNLSLKHERLLAKVGINNVKRLKQVGSTEAFIRLKKAGHPVNLLFYWNLTAALSNKNVNALTTDEKQRALDKLNLELNRYGFTTIKSE